MKVLLAFFIFTLIAAPASARLHSDSVEQNLENIGNYYGSCY